MPSFDGQPYKNAPKSTQKTASLAYGPNRMSRRILKSLLVFSQTDGRSDGQHTPTWSFKRESVCLLLTRWQDGKNTLMVARTCPHLLQVGADD
jgi:hypothetical protein